jgi:hypothetical protein
MFATLLKDNPPAAADAPMVAEMAQIGIVPGQDFDMSKLDPAVQAGLQAVPQAAQAQIEAKIPQIGTQTTTGWTISYGLGNYGTDYLPRAATAMGGLGANLPDDALYPLAISDSAGNPLNGSYNYTLHFDADKLKPSNAFWSLTMYNANGFPVVNSINRYALSSWMPLKLNADGSLDIYVGAASPGADNESNWLPAPNGPFAPNLRVYWPKQEVLNGTWIPPAFVKVS